MHFVSKIINIRIGFRDYIVKGQEMRLLMSSFTVVMPER